MHYTVTTGTGGTRRRGVDVIFLVLLWGVLLVWLFGDVRCRDKTTIFDRYPRPVLIQPTFQFPMRRALTTSANVLLTLFRSAYRLTFPFYRRKDAYRVPFIINALRTNFRRRRVAIMFPNRAVGVNGALNSDSVDYVFLILGRHPMEVRQRTCRVPLATVNFRFVGRPNVRFIIVSVIRVSSSGNVIRSKLCHVMSCVSGDDRINGILAMFRFLKDTIKALCVAFPRVVKHAARYDVFVPRRPQASFVACLGPLKDGSYHFRHVGCVNDVANSNFLRINRIRSFPYDELVLLSEINPPIAMVRICRCIRTRLYNALNFHRRVNHVTPIVIFFKISPCSRSGHVRTRVLRRLRAVNLRAKNVMGFRALVFRLHRPASINAFDGIYDREFLLVKGSADVKIYLVVTTTYGCYGNGAGGRDRGLRIFRNIVVVGYMLRVWTFERCEAVCRLGLSGCKCLRSFTRACGPVGLGKWTRFALLHCFYGQVERICLVFILGAVP